MVLCTPLFQRRVTSGTKSPKPHTESLMLSERRNGTDPSGVVKLPESVPASVVLTRPYAESMPTVTRPPQAGVWKVYIGRTKPRSPLAFTLAFRLADRPSGTRPI